MYVKRIILENVGPIRRLDIPFPGVDEGQPKPVIFVGENGSGKSILLSYIVNGLLMAQEAIYENAEVEKGKAYKFANPHYIKIGANYFLGKVEFEQKLGYHEWMLVQPKGEFKKTHAEEAERLVSVLKQEWENTGTDKESSSIDANLFRNGTKKVEEEFDRNCILYFPPNRFEEPAWLNQEDLKAQAEFLNTQNIKGLTNRRIINYAPLRDNQNWLFGVVFDQLLYEQQSIKTNIGNEQGNPILANVHLGYRGEATNAYNMALVVMREIMRKKGNLEFRIGKRGNRSIFLSQNDQVLIPDIFQLSTGEAVLLNLFLSILRDFDLSKTSLTKMEEIRGIVIVDEIDLHLHSVHQYEVLPALMRMFPRVQFVVTSHSPLFVLGLQNILGEDGFALFQLPDGKQISSEQFREFETAYRAFAETHQHGKVILAAIEKSQKPTLLVEGEIDSRYLTKAAAVLEKEFILAKFEMINGGGCGKLKSTEKTLKKMQQKTQMLVNEMILPRAVVLLYDCDTGVANSDNGKIHTRCISLYQNHPIKKGIENLFDKNALEKACKENSDFIVVTRIQKERGKEVTKHEERSVHDDKKTNLCNWFCEHGTADDFQHFKEVFDILEKILSDS